jgi:hypothetical protein
MLTSHQQIVKPGRFYTNSLCELRDNWDMAICFALGFSPSTPASSTTKTGRHDIAEILLKVALNTKNQNQIIK